MIDEKKLIEQIRTNGIPGEGFSDWERENAVVDIINSQPKIGEWIPCSKRLPEEKTNPVTSDFYEYQVTFKSDDVTDIRHYKFGRGHWWNGGGVIDDHVIAWQPLPEPYIGEQHEG